MSERFKKLIGLVSRTGGRLVVYDPNEELDPFVLLSLEEYENVLGIAKKGLTESDLSDKINRDIADWSQTRKTANLPEEFTEEDEDEDLIEFGDNLPFQEEILADIPEDFIASEAAKSPELDQSDNADSTEESDIKLSPRNSFASVGSILEDRKQQFARLRKNFQ